MNEEGKEVWEAGGRGSSPPRQAPSENSWMLACDWETVLAALGIHPPKQPGCQGADHSQTCSVPRDAQGKWWLLCHKRIGGVGVRGWFDCSESRDKLEFWQGSSVTNTEQNKPHESPHSRQRHVW